jgi:hypothetical protein
MDLVPCVRIVRFVVLFELQDCEVVNTAGSLFLHEGAQVNSLLVVFELNLEKPMLVVRDPLHICAPALLNKLVCIF